MSDDEKTQQTPVVRDWDTQDWSEPDGLLSELTGAGLTDEIELNVTLIVHGQMIVGTAIGGPRWFREQLEERDLDPETHESEFASFYRKMRDRADEMKRVIDLPADADLTDAELATLLDFTHVLHLKDAEVRLPGNVTYPPGLYMRVRLSSIDAWFTGRLTTSVGGAPAR